MPKSTISGSGGKPRKPRADFPLFPHGSGRWCKKVRGKFFYFGKVADDPKGEAALELWLSQRDEILAGRKPRPADGKVSLRHICNIFLTYKEKLVEAGEIKQTTWDDYYRTAARMIRVLGGSTAAVHLDAEDFGRLREDIAADWGPVRLGNEIQRVRSFFRYGYESGLLAVPVRFGPGFKKPTAKTLRLARAARGPLMFSPAELRSILEAAPVAIRPMAYLGLNGGLGASDCALLPVEAIDLAGGWLDYPRVKTGVPRRVCLWGETAAALKEWLAVRPEPKNPDHARLAFITPRGLSYAGAGKQTHWRVSGEFAKVLKTAGLQRPGRGFYTLRRVFQTVGEACGDFSAVAAIMGRVPRQNDMGSIYRQAVGDDRLRAVVDYVHDWLFPKIKAE